MLGGLPVKKISQAARDQLAQSTVEEVKGIVGTLRPDSMWNEIQAGIVQLKFYSEDKPIPNEFWVAILKAAKIDNYSRTMRYIMDGPNADEKTPPADSNKGGLMAMLKTMHELKGETGPEIKAVAQVLDCFLKDFHFDLMEDMPSYKQMYGMINEGFERKSIAHRLAMKVLEAGGKADGISLSQMAPPPPNS